MAREKDPIVIFRNLFSFLWLFWFLVNCSFAHLPLEQRSQSCPPGYEDPILILVSLDGFRADYLDRGLTPTISKLSQLGVRAPFIKPSYPAVTFSNHYTIVTGLLPPYHGIVANRFHDPLFKHDFVRGTPSSNTRRYYQGEPIWKTVENQGKIAATYFWPGSEVEALRPTYSLNYNKSHPFESRIDQVLQWISLPKEKRPTFITLYLHEPDDQGHDFGPYSQQVDDALKSVDQTITLLLQGLEEKKLLSCVNLIMLADHGMAEAGKDRVLKPQNLIPDINNRTRYWNGVFPRFEPLSGSQDEAKEMMSKLSCQSDSKMRVYLKTQAPVRWHLSSRRIEDVVIDLNAGYQVDFDNTYKPDEGDHGYDYIFKSMNALFLAFGPAFKRGIEVESFQNIEIYNLMCVVMGVEPAPNNGTWGALNHVLIDPPFDSRTRMLNSMKLPSMGELNPSVQWLRNRLSTSKCAINRSQSPTAYWLNLLKSAELNSNRLITNHAPWGIPQIADHHHRLKLLIHDDHITGFSEKLAMPLWTSFHVRSDSADGSEPVSWIDDIRLDSTSLPQPCKSLDRHHSWYPLFHPEFTRDDSMEQIPFLSSNAVPMTDMLRSRWHHLNQMLSDWAEMYGDINVVMGPVFDFDRDTFADDFSTFQRSNNNQVLLPTHMFAVATRCLGGGINCRNDYLDSVAFVFPQQLEVSNCMKFTDFSREFMAKVDDVEKITGFEFYHKMNFEDKTRLQIRVHSNIWGRDSWYNRLRTDYFGLKK